MSKSPTLGIYLNEQAQKAKLEIRLPSDLDAGFDLPILDDTVIAPNGFALLNTGVHFAIPAGWVGLVRDRSSVALRGGVTSAGVIDASYRGEVKVAMHNLSAQPLCFKQGERVAQCVIVPHLPGVAGEIVSSLSELGQTDRGIEGFGSTGK